MMDEEEADSAQSLSFLASAASRPQHLSARGAFVRAQRSSSTSSLTSSTSLSASSSSSSSSSLSSASVPTSPSREAYAATHSSSDPTQDRQSKKRKRKQVTRACLACRHAKAACSDSRPCDRCVAMDMVEACIDVPRKKRRSAKGVVAVGEGSIAQPPSIEVHTDHDERSMMQEVRQRLQQGLPAAPAHRRMHDLAEMSLAPLQQQQQQQHQQWDGGNGGGPTPSRSPFSCYEFRGTWTRHDSTTSILRSCNDALKRLVGEQDVVFKNLLTPEHRPLAMMAFEKMFALGCKILSFVARVDWRIENCTVPMVMAVHVRYENGRPYSLDQYASVVDRPGTLSEVAYTATVEMPNGEERQIPVAYFVSGPYKDDLYTLKGNAGLAQRALQIAQHGSPLSSPSTSAPSSPRRYTPPQYSPAHSPLMSPSAPSPLAQFSAVAAQAPSSPAPPTGPSSSGAPSAFGVYRGRGGESLPFGGGGGGGGGGSSSSTSSSSTSPMPSFSASSSSSSTSAFAVPSSSSAMAPGMMANLMRGLPDPHDAPSSTNSSNSSSRCASGTGSPVFAMDVELPFEPIPEAGPDVNSVGPEPLPPMMLMRELDHSFGAHARRPVPTPMKLPPIDSPMYRSEPRFRAAHGKREGHEDAEEGGAEKRLEVHMMRGYGARLPDMGEERTLSDDVVSVVANSSSDDERDGNGFH